MVDWLNDLGSIWSAWVVTISWQVALLAMIVLALDATLLRRAWPQVRYALWMLVLLRLIIPPGFALPTSIGPQLAKSLTEQTMAHLPEARVPSATTPLAVARRAISSTPSEARLSYSASASREVALSGRACAMLITVAISAVFMGIALLRIHRLRLSAASTAAVPNWLIALVGSCADRLKLRRAPRIIVSRTVPSAAVLGVLRPALLLPAGALSGDGAGAQAERVRMEYIVLHELSHIKRGDALVNAAQTVLQFIFWFHPMVWLTGARLRHLREACCDGTVANLLRERTREYCQTLVLAAERMARVRGEAMLGLLGLFENPSKLRQRLSYLRRPSWRNTRMRKTIAAASMALCFALVVPMGVTARAVAAARSDASHATRIVDRTDYPFVDDAAAHGDWITVDCVREISDFQPGQKQLQGFILLKGLAIYDEGATASWTEFDFDASGSPSGWYLRWTKGLVINLGEQTAGKYEIRNIGDKKYMFFEWKTGDYIFRNMKPWYYVLEQCDSDKKVRDRIDQPFIDDPALHGTWEAFDYIQTPDAFDPDERQWGKERAITPAKITFDPNGKTSGPWVWTKGLFIDPRNQTAAAYIIKELTKTTYLFIEWKNDNYVFRGQKSGYLVFTKGGTDDRLVDRAEHSFVDDPAVVGRWTSVDFVREIDQFVPENRSFPDAEKLFLASITFRKGGQTSTSYSRGGKITRSSGVYRWTKGFLIEPLTPTASRYSIKEIGGKDYMFFEWKSGDYTIRKMKPMYYVLVRADAEEEETDSEEIKDIGLKMERLDIEKAAREDVIAIFGAPTAYIWGENVFSADNLPDDYIMSYTGSFMVWMKKRHVMEVRFQGPSDYVFGDGLRVGSTLEEALRVMGQPKQIVQGNPTRQFEDGVLYNNIRGINGLCHYMRKELGVRVFMTNGHVNALYLMRKGPVAE